MEISVLGIVLGKTVCSVAGVDGTGAVVMRNRVQPFRLVEFLAQLPPCVVPGSCNRPIRAAIQASAVWPASGFQFQGNISSMRLILGSWMRATMSAR